MTNPKKNIPIPGSERVALPDAHVVGPMPPTERIQISVILRPRKSLKSLKSAGFLKAAPPSARKYMSRMEFAKAYGANPADIKKVEAFAHDHHLTVMQVSPERRTIILAGTVADLSNAFGIKLFTCERPGETFRSHTGPVSVREDLTGIIQGVFGFDTRRQARPRFRQRSSAAHALQSTPAYTPNQVAALYNFPTNADGKGQSIGILEFGGGYNQSDLETYFTQLGIPEPSITAISVDGVQNQPSPGPNSPDAEVALDLEVAGAVAPGASLVVYFCDFTERGWVDAITTVVHDSVHNPSVISISWGYPEGQATWTAQAMQAVNDAFQAAATMGITVCVASGDDGSRDDVSDGQAHVDFPSSSPYVLACGGTSLFSANNAITSEVVWNDGSNGGASGGGVSETFPLPPWQSKAKVPLSVNPSHFAGRGVPDVAGDADPQTGYQILVDGATNMEGGTSAVAPLWAGLIACINQAMGKPVGFLNPLIYNPTVAAGGAFRDITSGNNDVANLGAYSAGIGWDACTGWGSPNGAALLAALKTPSPAVRSKPGKKTAAKPKARKK